jgi:tetratricopeptide (TPR) repeat protein
MSWEDDWYEFWYEEVYETNEYRPNNNNDNKVTQKSERKLSDYEYYCRQAKTCSIKGDHLTAIKFYNEALHCIILNHGKWEVFCAIAGEYEEMEDYNLAEAYWNRCRELEETGGDRLAPRRIAQRADFLYRRCRWKEAIAAYEKALKALKALGDNQIGLDALRICAGITHHIIGSYCMLGRDIPEEKYHDEFRHEISRHISADKRLSDEQIAHYLSETAWELYADDWLTDEALILIDSAINLNPNPPANDYNRKALMLNGNHRFKEAMRYYKKALLLDGSNETILNNRAECIRQELETKILHNRTEPHDLGLINEALKILPEGYDNRPYLSAKAEILNELGERVKAKICKALAAGNYGEVERAEKQLKKLKSSETYINITGTQYYRHFEPFRQGTVVDLIREPENPHDKYAIRVEIRGETVGYVANSKYTLIKEVKSARDLENVSLKQAEVQFILLNEWVIAKLIESKR